MASFWRRLRGALSGLSATTSEVEAKEFAVKTLRPGGTPIAEVSFADSFNLGGVKGDARDIVKLTPNGNSYTPSLYWDGSAAGFPVAIDGLEMIN